MSTPADVKDQVQVKLLIGTSNLKIHFLLRKLKREKVVSQNN
jgi:hypothetical protein